MRKLGLSTLAIAASLWLTAGCQAAMAGTATDANPLRLDFSWPANVGPLNPHLYTPNQMFAQAMVYEPLVRYQHDGTITPWLARSWTLSEDGRIYRFTLRDDVYFSNGEPFDAAAVVANMRAVLANRDQHSWLEMVNQIESVEQSDIHVVTLTLAKPYPPLLQELALPRPFRFVAPSQFVDGGTRSGIKAPVGTGPWQLRETRQGEHDLFARNDRYWNSKPVYDQIMVKVIPDANSRIIAFETGEIDLIFGRDGAIPPDSVERLRKSGTATMALSQPQETRLIALNSKTGPTRDEAVRRAINHAIDKDVIISALLHGTEARADSLFAPNVPYADLGLEPYAFDTARAGQLLDQAGWAMGPDGLRVRNGENLASNIVFVGTDAVSRSIAEVVQSFLARIGIATELIGEEESSVNARERDGRFGMIFHRTWGPPYDPHALLSSMRAPSHSDYQAQSGLPDKAAIDASISQALLTGDEAERRNLYRKVLTRLHEAAVYVPLTHIRAIAISRPEMAEIPFGAIASEIPFDLMRPVGK